MQFLNVSLVFTLKHGTYLPPGSHPTLTSVLSQRCLQEKHGDATEEEEHAVGDEEDTYNYRHKLFHQQVG